MVIILPKLLNRNDSLERAQLAAVQQESLEAPQSLSSETQQAVVWEVVILMPQDKQKTPSMSKANLSLVCTLRHR